MRYELTDHEWAPAGFCRPDRTPDGFRRQRHIDVGDAERRQRIKHRADDRGRRGNRSRFAAAFRAQRVVGAWLALVEFGFDQRQISGAGQRVVQELPGQDLAAAIVEAQLAQRLAQALGDAAVNLSVDDHRVDHGADVVDAPITGHGRLAC
jgi:hypothetical protein